MLYVRPMYVSSSSTESPYLDDFIAVYEGRTGFGPTLNSVLQQVVNGVAPPTASKGATAAELIKDAQTEYDAAVQALKTGGVSGFDQYQADLTKMSNDINEAETILAGKSTKAPTTKKT
jgi:uncharacterized membrane protein (UPF0182 family)